MTTIQGTGLRRCSRCGEIRETYRYWCRSCRAAAGRERYAANPERQREIKRESMRRFRADPEKRARANATKAERWAERYAPQQRRRLTDLKERHFFVWRARIASRYGNSVTAAQLAHLWRDQRGLCALTGRRLDRSAELDHIHPRSRAGGNDLVNLRWVCKEANQAKRDLTDEEFLTLCQSVAEWLGRRLADALR